MIKSAITLGFCAAALLLAGCVNLSEVRKLASASAKVANVREVTRDFSSTLERRNVVRADGAAELTKEQIDERKEGQAELERGLVVISDYMLALEALAANDLPEYNKQIEKLGTSIKTAKLADDKNIGQAKIAANLLTRIFTDVYRRKKLREIVPAVNPMVTNLCVTIGDRINRVYLESLDTELNLTRTYLDKAGKTDQGAKLLAVMLLRQQESALKEKRQIANAATVGLAKVAQAHDALTQNIGKVSSDEAKLLLTDYRSAIESAYKLIKGD